MHRWTKGACRPLLVSLPAHMAIQSHLRHPHADSEWGQQTMKALRLHQVSVVHSFEFCFCSTKFMESSHISLFSATLSASSIFIRTAKHHKLKFKSGVSSKFAHPEQCRWCNQVLKKDTGFRQRQYLTGVCILKYSISCLNCLVTATAMHPEGQNHTPSP